MLFKQSEILKTCLTFNSEISWIYLIYKEAFCGFSFINYRKYHHAYLDDTAISVLVAEKLILVWVDRFWLIKFN